MTAPTSSLPPTSGPSELWERVITGVILTVVSFSIIWWGVYPFACMVAIFSSLGLWEFYSLAERKGLRPGKRIGLILNLAIVVTAAFWSEFVAHHVLILGFVLMFSVLLLRPQERVSPLLDSALTMLGVIYVSWFFSFLVHLRKLPQGAELLTLLIFATAFTDMGGYFIGRRFGKTKLYPRVSPKKTVEGALGGGLVAMIACSVSGLVMGIPVLHCLTAAMLVAIVGQMGDLFESSLKRDVGVKDSGRILRGHGGVLDRFDSLALAAPIFYLYTVYFIL